MNGAWRTPSFEFTIFILNSLTSIRSARILIFAVQIAAASRYQSEPQAHWAILRDYCGPRVKQNAEMNGVLSELIS